MENKKQILTDLLRKRILLLDGAMGTMIQKHQLKEEDFRGEQYKNWKTDLRGNNDILSITQPTIISNIHAQYLEAGADLIETNTFNANAISLADYGMENEVYAINYQSAKLAKEQTIKYSTPDKPRFAVGAIGPTSKTASLSPKVEDPAYREVDFNQLKNCYKEQAIALIEGGVDILLIETVFDTLNAKAATFGVSEAFETTKTELPLMVSGTITDASGRTLSGQTTEAFIISLMHVDLLSIGLNCALGADMLTPYVKALADNYTGCTSVHPNAGLPNAFGEYDESPEMMAGNIKHFLENNWINIVGGCCGTTPDHIKALAKLTKEYKPKEF